MGRILITEAALLPCWVIMAWWQAGLIKKQRPIRHGWWAALSGALIGAAMWWSDLPLFWPMAGFGAIQAGMRLAVFNASLNWFRGLSFTYISSTSTSILDKIEIRLFGSKSWLLEIILAAIFVTYQFFL